MTTSSTSVAMTTCPASSAKGELFERVAANLFAVRARIASTGRDTATVRIVAVTKTFAPQYVRAAAAAGLKVMGENYVDELAEKRDEVTDLALTWHYLGALQSNKIHRAVLSADVLCGVSRLKEIERIASTRGGAAIYVQVDFTGSAQRNGAAPQAVAALVQRGRALGLDVRGLMTVAPIDPEGARSAFRATTALADDLGLCERSMGMTNDLEAACELGSSEVRVGRALFGPREPVQPPDLT
jgi:uncharacterized pyridoxal phosphate-containing UPF0001 family protein